MDYYQIRIQKRVPIPVVKPRGPGGRRPPRYPWDKMEVGDSFLFPPEIGRASYAAAIQASRMNPGKTFVAYKTDEGFRCWRTQ